MELLVNHKEKELIVKNIINSNKYLRKTNNASSIFMALGYGCLLFYFCFYSLVSQLDLKTLLISTALFVVFFVLATLSKVAVVDAVKQDLLERTDEKLTYKEEELIYSFRNKYETNSEDRIRIHIPLKNITNVEYKKCKSKLILTGNFSRKYATNCGTSVMPPHRGRVVSEKEIDTFVLYDYFEPSLYEYFKNRELYAEFMTEKVPQKGE